MSDGFLPPASRREILGQLTAAGVWIATRRSAPPWTRRGAVVSLEHVESFHAALVLDRLEPGATLRLAQRRGATTVAFDRWILGTLPSAQTFPRDPGRATLCAVDRNARGRLRVQVRLEPSA